MEELKTAKRIRKLDQEKALREQEKQNEKERALLRQRLTIKNDFVV